MLLTKKNFIWDNGYTLFNIIRCQFSSNSDKIINFKRIIEKEVYTYLNYSNFSKIIDQINIEYSLTNKFKAEKVTFLEYKEIIAKLKDMNYFLFLENKLILSKGKFSSRPTITKEYVKKYITSHTPFILFNNTNSNNVLFESIFNYEYLINNYFKKNNLNIEISTYFDIPSQTLHIEIIPETNITDNQITEIVNLFKNLDKLITTENINNLIDESKRIYNYFVYDQQNAILLEKNILSLLNMEHQDINKINDIDLKTIFTNIATSFKYKTIVISK